MPHDKGCYSLPYPEGRSGVCSCKKLDKPAFAGESQTDREARTVLTVPVPKDPCMGYKTVYCVLPEGHTGNCKFDRDIPF